MERFASYWNECRFFVSFPAVNTHSRNKDCGKIHRNNMQIIWYTLMSIGFIYPLYFNNNFSIKDWTKRKKLKII